LICCSIGWADSSQGTSKELHSEIYADDVKEVIGSGVLEFKVVVDERRTPSAREFFVELNGKGKTSALE